MACTKSKVCTRENGHSGRCNHKRDQVGISAFIYMGNGMYNSICTCACSCVVGFIISGNLIQNYSFTPSLLYSFQLGSTVCGKNSVSVGSQSVQNSLLYSLPRGLPAYQPGVANCTVTSSNIHANNETALCLSLFPMDSLHPALLYSLPRYFLSTQSVQNWENVT